MMEMTHLAIFAVSFVASMLSGVAGGGASFVVTPFWLVIGMTPAQGGATGAFMATGMSLSSVAAFRQSGHLPKNNKLLYSLVAIVFFASVLGAFIVPRIDIDAFKIILATLTICAIPLIFLKQNSRYNLKKYKFFGFVLAALFMAIGSIIVNGAFSILFTLTLVSFFGMSVLQTTAIKRLLFFVQSVVLLFGFALQGYLIWGYAIAGFMGGTFGAYIGTKYAVKKGEMFAKYTLAAVSLVGSVALLI